MTDELLPWYNRELAWFRRHARDFARNHPKIASRLRLGADGSQDPHVERMIEAFAYLNARTRKKIDDNFPELTDALLHSLYPHFLAPLPSMFITQLTLQEGEVTDVAGYSVARGTALETEPIDGEPCRFRTCYDVTLLPLRVASAELRGLPVEAPLTPFSADAQSVLRIRLNATAQERPLRDMVFDSLRLFLNGSVSHVYALHELLLNNCLGLAVGHTASDDQAAWVRGPAFAPVGFEDDQSILPYPPHSQPGYRLLTEFFSFPAKFLFVDLTSLQQLSLDRFEDSLEVFVYLDRSILDLEQNVTAETFRTGCTPVVNLFEQRAEPIHMNETSTSYRLSADIRRPQAVEIYSIDQVTASSPDGDELEFLPFHSASHHTSHDDTAYWQQQRVDADSNGAGVDEGTEIDLTFVDLNASRALRDDWYIDAQVTCCNRDLPARLPYGGGQPRLYLSDGQGAVGDIRCLTAPTATVRPQRRRPAFWQLISHLSLNHLSIVDEADGGAALREILNLYNINDDLDGRTIISGLLSVTSRRVTRRIPGDRFGGFCRGVEVELEFDAERYSRNNLYLFASVLERFLGLYCSINSFTRLIARVRGREQPLAAWEARAGDKVLI